MEQAKQLKALSLDQRPVEKAQFQFSGHFGTVYCSKWLFEWVYTICDPTKSRSMLDSNMVLQLCYYGLWHPNNLITQCNLTNSLQQARESATPWDLHHSNNFKAKVATKTKMICDNRETNRGPNPAVGFQHGGLKWALLPAPSTHP